MIAKRLGADAALTEQIEKINREAFPPEEYMPISEMLEVQARGEFDVLALLDGETAVGFMAVSADERAAYLFFLAIGRDYRSKGYGGQALALYRSLYAGRQCTVDLEPLDPDAENAEQRVRRRRFYLKNGFAPSGYALEYRGAAFELLCCEPPLRVEAFAHLAEGLHVRGFVPKLLPMKNQP